MSRTQYTCDNWIDGILASASNVDQALLKHCLLCDYFMMTGNHVAHALAINGAVIDG